MSRPFRTDAGSCLPRMVPWRDWDEWYRVKALLFSPEPYLRSRGVQHVAVWQSRERVPHAVETTSQLVEVRLNDVGVAGGGLGTNGARRGEEELRLIYSAVVVRAVNGLTGHEQKMVHAAPVSSLAKEIGLPTWIVDIRHEAAHKQLPGIVTLRLASDFLVDYLWRRYWDPQAEHLAFVWGAFDQLICRYKATSKSDASLPPKSTSSSGNACPRRRRSPPAAQANNKKRRTDPPAGSISGSPASLKDMASSTGGIADESYSPNTPRNSSRGNSGPPGSSPSSPSPPERGHGAAAEVEVAAREIALSATPTALAWALVSLLADGGTVSGDGADGFAGARRRGQGHLLPRSRDRYPTPGTLGVDTGEVGRRITTRWATLLNIFHAKYRGFGAALLVRLVEVLLGNAASPSPSSPPTTPSNNAAHPGGAGASSSSSGGGGGGGGGGGLERQAAFIKVWVRHLLSRRWHLRSGDATVRSGLREAAADAGLSPAFCDEQDWSWEEEQSAWADKAAPLPVLHAAFFPVRELLERCRRLLETLPMGTAPAVWQAPPAALGLDGTSPSGHNAAAPPAAPSDGTSANNNTHWARAGLDAVCRVLAEALPGEGVTPATCDAAAPPVTAAFAARGDGDRAGVGAAAGTVAVGDQSPSSAFREVGSDVSGGSRGSCGDQSAPDPMAVPMGGVVVRGGGGGGGGRVGEGSFFSGGDGRGSGDSAESVTSAGSTAAAASATMMDLDDLERLLGAEGPCPPSSVASRDGDGSCPSASAVAVDDAPAGVAGAEWKSGSREAARTGVVGVTTADGHSDAWELVEAWTPCAIGTLAGWSAARLF